MLKIKEVNSYIPIDPIYGKECGVVNAVISLFYDNGFREDAEEMTKVWQNGVTKELLTGVHQFFSKIADRTIQIGSDFGRQKISCAETIKEANYIPCILNQLLLNAQEHKNLLLYGDLRYPYNLIQEVYSLSPSETSTFIRLYEDTSNDIANTTAYAIAAAGRACCNRRTGAPSAGPPCRCSSPGRTHRRSPPGPPSASRSRSSCSRRR